MRGSNRIAVSCLVLVFVFKFNCSLGDRYLKMYVATYETSSP